jgi:glycerol-3-phosphate dehydrogenase (NAD(P)+)
MTKKLSVLGAGAWGTALAVAFSSKFDTINIWSYLQEDADIINQKHENANFLPDIKLPENIVSTTSMKESLENASVILSASPSFTLPKIWQEATTFISGETPFINVSKGLDQKSQLLPHQLFLEIFKDKVPYYSLCGPSFAEDTAKGSLTGVMLAGEDKGKAIALIKQLETDTFFLKYTHDIVGVETAAIMKNVIAVASGMSLGLGYGPNTQALVVVHGLQEMIELGTALGAIERTFFDLAGLGDLLLTAMNKNSRNMSLGYSIGQGKSVEESLKELKGTSEGYQTAHTLHLLIEKYALTLPVMQLVIDVLYNNAPPRETLQKMLQKCFVD